MSNGQPLIPPRDKTFHLAHYDPGYSAGLDKDAARAELPYLATRIDELQNVLYAAKSHAVLVIMQGIDTSGKDGTVTAVFSQAGPIGSRVVSFGVPTDEEASHDFLWRYHRETPRLGNVVIFNRSYYESVLVERVKGLVPEATWRKRYDEINQFEAYLAAQGTVLLKFFLHISKDEQRERLQERVDNPKKHWKFNPRDLAEREFWDGYQSAFEEMVHRCNTKAAPWHVVPANHNWYRNLVVAKAIVEKLDSMGLKYPEPEQPLTGIVVE